jgi:rhodanese-related sulfurtransferase
MKMKSLVFVMLGLATSLAFAQEGPATSVSAAPAADVWKYKTKRLDRAAIDALLAKPKKLLVIDVRRPDELTVKGSFPVYLNIQAKEVEKNLAYIPKDRTIITVSNRAHRAGDVGDLLASKGFKVAGAAGSVDYEEQGGTAIVRVTPPPPKTAAVAAPK